MKTSEMVFCDLCNKKNIDPNELYDGELNLSQVGGGYVHEYCMSDEQMEEYEESLLL